MALTVPRTHSGETSAPAPQLRGGAGQLTTHHQRGHPGLGTVPGNWSREERKHARSERKSGQLSEDVEAIKLKEPNRTF